MEARKKVEDLIKFYLRIHSYNASEEFVVGLANSILEELNYEELAEKAWMYDGLL